MAKKDKNNQNIIYEEDWSDKLEPYAAGVGLAGDVVGLGTAATGVGIPIGTAIAGFANIPNLIIDGYQTARDTWRSFNDNGNSLGSAAWNGGELILDAAGLKALQYINQARRAGVKSEQIISSMERKATNPYKRVGTGASRSRLRRSAESKKLYNAGRNKALEESTSTLAKKGVRETQGEYFRRKLADEMAKRGYGVSVNDAIKSANRTIRQNLAAVNTMSGGTNVYHLLSKHKSGGQIRKMQTASGGPINWLRKRIYTNIEPFGYNNIGSRLYDGIILNKNEHSNFKGDYSDIERAPAQYLTIDNIWGEYLHIPEKERRYSNGKYKIKNNGNGTFSLPFKSMEDIMLTVNSNNPLLWGLRGKAINSVVGEYDIYRGYDKKGDYLKYIDHWRINPYDVKEDKEYGLDNNSLLKRYFKGKDDASFGLGTPVEIQGKYYLDDIYNVKGKDRGGHYLPEVIVTGKKKQGGKINIIKLFKEGGQIRKMLTASGGPLFPWQLNTEWINGWKFRTTPASRSRVLSGKGVETDKQYTERRKKETTKRTWRSDAADIAHGIGEGVLALNPYTAIPYFGAKVGLDFLNGNVSWQTALNASVPLFHLAPQAVGLREATNVALEDAANAGSKTARNWRVAREINLAIKNKPKYTGVPSKNLFRTQVYKGGEITDPYSNFVTTDPLYAANYGKVTPYIFESRSVAKAKEPMMGSSDPVTMDMFIYNNTRRNPNATAIIGHDAATGEFTPSKGIEILNMSPKNLYPVKTSNSPTSLKFFERKPSKTSSTIQISPEELYKVLKDQELNGYYFMGHGTGRTGVNPQIIFDNGLRVKNGDIGNTTIPISESNLTSWPHMNSEEIIIMPGKATMTKYDSAHGHIPSDWYSSDVFHWTDNPKKVGSGPFAAFEPNASFTEQTIGGVPGVYTKPEAVLGSYNTRTHILKLNPRSLYEFLFDVPKLTVPSKNNIVGASYDYRIEDPKGSMDFLKLFFALLKINGKEYTLEGLKDAANVQQGLPKYIQSYLNLNTVERAVRAMRKDGYSEREIQLYIDKVNEEMNKIKVGMYSDLEYNAAGALDFGGFYNNESNFISVNKDAHLKDSKFTPEYIMKHEGRHLIDYNTSMTDDVINTLEKAYDKDFLEIPKHEDAGSLKDYQHMDRERVTTNRDARDVLLTSKGKHLLNEHDFMLYASKNGLSNNMVDFLNKIIKYALPEDIVNAVENSNGYGKRYINYLKKNNKLTPTKIEQLRLAMIHVPSYLLPVAGGYTLYNLFNLPLQQLQYLKQGGKMNVLEFLKNGSGIHIKEKNKGKFTSYCGGKVTDECILKGKNSSNPAIRKRATFADNARHFKHKSGGSIEKLEKGSWISKGLNFLNESGLGKTLLEGGLSFLLSSSLNKSIAGATDVAKAELDKEKQEASDYALLMATKKALEMLLMDPNNPNAFGGSIVLNYIRLQLYNEYLNSINLDIANRKALLDMLSLQMLSENTSGAISGIIQSGLGVVGNLLGGKKDTSSTNSTTYNGTSSSTKSIILPKLTSNKWTPSTSLSNPVLGNNALGSMPNYTSLLNVKK